MPVICADPDLASCAKTPRPSIASTVPLFPVPALTLGLLAAPWPRPFGAPAPVRAVANALPVVAMVVAMIFSYIAIASLLLPSLSSTSAMCSSISQ